MWVSDDGWIDEVIATPWVRSRSGLTCQTSRADDGLGVGPGQLAQPFGELRQFALVAHLEQQMLRSPGACGQHHVLSGKGALLAAHEAPGAGRANLPDPVFALFEVRDGRHRNHFCAFGFREAEVVLEQRVLGAVAASGHAAAAFQAARAVGAGTAEVRVGNRLTGRLGAVGPEEHPDRGGHEGVTAAHVLGNLFEHPVGVGEGRIGDHAEHSLGLFVVRHQLRLPIGDVRPLLVGEERLRRHVERVRVVQRPTTNAGAGQDHHVAQQMDALDAVHTQFGRPQEFAEVPRGLGHVLVGEAPAGFENADPVALLRQAQRGDAAAKTRTDDQDVVVRFHVPSMYLPVGNEPENLVNGPPSPRAARRRASSPGGQMAR